MRTLLFAALLAVSAAAAAQKAEIYADRAGAIRGYDPVAYFTEKAPAKGSDKFTHSWKGATWRFASAQNRDRFAASPQLQPGRARSWEKDIPGYIRKADANWPGVLR
mgnify:FL=1